MEFQTSTYFFRKETRMYTLDFRCFFTTFLLAHSPRGIITNSALWVSLFFICLLTPTTTLLANQLDLPKDINGWTIFTPSNDTRIMYVSNSGDDATGTIYTKNSTEVGSDPFKPGAVKPFATYAAAYANARVAYPDWILIKRGETFTEAIYSSIRDGRSATEPFLIASYGTAGLSPILKTGSTTGLRFFGSKEWVAVSGIEFYAHTRDPDSADYINGDGATGLYIYATAADEKVQGILIEGCRFRFYANNGLITGNNDVVDGVTLYRNVMLDSYWDAAHSQGLFLSHAEHIILKENIFDHNGWYSQADSGGIGEATIFNHNTYISEANNIEMDSNIFTRPSSVGNKFRSDIELGMINITVNNNLYVDTEMAFGFNGEGTADIRFQNITATNNVITNLGRSQPTNRTLGWGIEFNSIDIGAINNNYIINQPLDAITGVIGILLDRRLTNIDVSNNVLYGLRFSNSFQLKENGAYTVSDIAITNNKIQIPQDSGYSMTTEFNPIGMATFSGNTYYSDKTAGTRYRITGVDKTLAEWQAATGDDSTFEAYAFPNPLQSIETYQQSISKPATIDAFIESCRLQDRYNWDVRYTASAVNTWIRSGFRDPSAPIQIPSKFIPLPN